MRPICGAIIAAGALIGLGLTSIGIGLRYQNYPLHLASGEPQWVKFGHLDTALMLSIVVVLLMLVVGMALAFHLGWPTITTNAITSCSTRQAPSPSNGCTFELRAHP